jgi:hypothetical protein
MRVWLAEWQSREKMWGYAHPRAGIRSFEIDLSVQGNFWNPFSGSATISYDLVEAQQVRLKVYDILGRRLRTLPDKRQQKGVGNADWNGREVPSGS